MKRILLLVLIAFLFACNNQKKAQLEIAESFDVGVIIPLSGELAGYGQAVANGIELARLEQPQLFKNIKFHYQDSKYDSKVAVSAFRALNETGKMDLYHVWGVSPNESLIPILESKKIPAVVETTLKNTTLNKKYIIRAATTGENLANLLLDELVKREVEKIGLVSVQIPYYEDILKYFTAEARKKNIKVEVVSNYLPDVNDFKVDIFKLEQNNYDSLGLFLLPSQYLTFYRQASASTLPVNIFAAGIPNSQKLVDSLPDNVNGLFIVTLGKLTEFRPRYIAKFGNDEFAGAAAQSYDFATLVASNFNNLASKKLSAKDIINKFKSNKNITGVTGVYSFKESESNGMSFDMPIGLREVKDKVIVDMSVNALWRAQKRN